MGSNGGARGCYDFTPTSHQFRGGGHKFSQFFNFLGDAKFHGQFMKFILALFIVCEFLGHHLIN